MEFRFKHEWTVASVQDFEKKFREIYEEALGEVAPIWRQIMMDLYRQIITTYYEYEPTMYGRIGGGGHLFGAYNFSIERSGGYTSSVDTFETEGHWQITGSDNFQEEGIMQWILSGNRSLPPWVRHTSMPRTYIVSVYLPEIGYSGVGNPRDIWEQVDNRVGEYITDKISEIMWEKMQTEFYESFGGYVE